LLKFSIVKNKLKAFDATLFEQRSLRCERRLLLTFFEIAHFPKGVYFLKIENHVQKVVKF
jgi:hypothetical protein